MEILRINVIIDESYSVKGKCMVNMVLFHGEAHSDLFSGKILPGGVDTQIYSEDKSLISAKYILEGTDKSGGQCRIFIHNRTSSDGKLRPAIITDSKSLAYLQDSRLWSEIIPTDDGVDIRICEE
ncbi:MAG: DUF3237 domain-containing protein [Oscillospiraceae bacterium]|nr:DUF3237 domain-containing protein [Oscillospiraceae bacterium]